MIREEIKQLQCLWCNLKNIWFISLILLSGREIVEYLVLIKWQCCWWILLTVNVTSYAFHLVLLSSDLDASECVICLKDEEKKVTLGITYTGMDWKKILLHIILVMFHHSIVPKYSHFSLYWKFSWHKAECKFICQSF